MSKPDPRPSPIQILTPEEVWQRLQAMAARHPDLDWKREQDRLADRSLRELSAAPASKR